MYNKNCTLILFFLLEELGSKYILKTIHPNLMILLTNLIDVIGLPIDDLTKEIIQIRLFLYNVAPIVSLEFFPIFVVAIHFFSCPIPRSIWNASYSWIIFFSFFLGCPLLLVLYFGFLWWAKKSSSMFLYKMLKWSFGPNWHQYLFSKKIWTH